jgi:hypothetical protein
VAVFAVDGGVDGSPVKVERTLSRGSMRRRSTVDSIPEDAVAAKPKTEVIS